MAYQQSHDLVVDGLRGLLELTGERLPLGQRGGDELELHERTGLVGQIEPDGTGPVLIGLQTGLLWQISMLRRPFSVME